jgi:hypothetical protein
MVNEMYNYNVCITAENLVLLLCTFGFAFNIILIIIQGNLLAVHKNALILLINHHIALILQCIFFGIREAYVLVKYRVFNNPCELMETFGTCLLFRFVPGAAAYVTQLSLAMMAGERFCASYKYKTYEQTSIAFGVCLGIIQVGFLFVKNFISQKFAQLIILELSRTVIARGEH